MKAEIYKHDIERIVTEVVGSKCFIIEEKSELFENKKRISICKQIKKENIFSKEILWVFHIENNESLYKKLILLIIKLYYAERYEREYGIKETKLNGTH